MEKSLEIVHVFFQLKTMGFFMLHSVFLKLITSDETSTNSFNKAISVVFLFNLVFPGYVLDT